MITDNTTNAIQQYVENQTSGAVTEPVNGSWIQAYCLYLGITEPVNSSWMQALCNHFGITQPLYSSWVIALANHYGITQPTGGTWWMALANAGVTPLYPPTADFTSNVTTIYENDSIDFEDTSTVDPLGPPITSWLWTFEGGTPGTATDENPTIDYNIPGTYQVSLQVTNADGSDTKTVPGYVTVVATPVAGEQWDTNRLSLNLHDGQGNWVTNRLSLKLY